MPDETILRTALSLGGRPDQIFARIVLPMALRGVLSAVALGFLIAFGEFLIAMFLTTSSLETLPIRIYQAVQYELTLAVAVISVLLMAAVCFSLTIASLYSWLKDQLALTRINGVTSRVGATR